MLLQPLFPILKNLNATHLGKSLSPHKQTTMTSLIQTGKKRTLSISLSVVLISIHTIYFYHAVRPEIETDKLIQQLIRFALTLGLLVLVYKGVRWAKSVAIVLFSLAIIVAVLGLITIATPSLVSKVPLMVMVFIYGLAVYHFAFAKSFKAFFAFQNARLRGQDLDDESEFESND